VTAVDEHLEIERRFLVDARGEKPWRSHAISHSIEQHYAPRQAFTVRDGVLHGFDRPLTTVTETESAIWEAEAKWVVRLRRKNDRCIVTCKARKTNDTAAELEWTVAETDMEAMLAHGPFPSIVKTRYEWTAPDNTVWEVDEFEGALAGVVLAEVELTSSEQTFDIPAWAGQEVTGLASWSNHALSSTLGGPKP